MRWSCIIQVDPKPRDKNPSKGETEGDLWLQRRPCEDWGRDRRDTAEEARERWEAPEQEEARKDSPPELSEDTQFCWHLDFGRVASRAVREYISFVLSHQVCGNLFQQPQETMTEGISPPSGAPLSLKVLPWEDVNHLLALWPFHHHEEIEWEV